ncbi:periplasmic heavy metal sensor [Stutzerimonas stutzeri]|uniref:periplasmic heavy metal sensor n=1 Tax=Stutzerimonas sp. S1 TaxID=3030652 RepID=UPI002225A93B|nr:periplasmic heavy metal sensor [Stutzerimonas sp. S1]MCW3147143.1 periplasmic heavy metal sensor [Stutzerimonas sp. S1]
MNTSTLRGALALSLLVNCGVLGTLAWQKLQTDGLPMPSGAPTELSRQLELSANQLGRWHDGQAPYLAQLHALDSEFDAQRGRLLEALLGEQVDPAQVAREQAKLSELREARQQLQIDQLLSERELLDARQRQKLVNFLARQNASAELASLHAQ